MRRLRAVAVIAGLAFAWLGYFVAREIAAERAGGGAPPLQTASSLEPSTSRNSGVDAPKPLQFPDLTALPRTSARVPRADDSALPNPSIPAATSPAPVDSAPVADATVQAQPLVPSPAHVPFLQAALMDAHSSAGSGGHARSGGGFGGAMSGGGGGGGGVGSGGGSASAESPAVVDEPLIGDGVARVLGRKFSLDGGESNDDAGSNGNDGSNGNNGSNGSNGNNDSNGNNKGSNDSTGNTGSNGPSGGSGSNGGNGPSGSNGSHDGSNQGNDGGPSNDQGTGGFNGGDKGGAPEGGISSFAASFDDGPSGDGDDVPAVREVPEPGSILLGLGAAMALVRRRMR